ncbi:hypothetical protein SISNIDRAFT_552876 [Sistotremastrum niveocremeum HHB9708]|uniref:F-box domain-containing protein n=1 Tax=Sistotremastrum niveocremeum HHB9708 TaxID=1314777 RepID=A0A164NU31_9AGAM|nr:hypothetical protein SISNIDRAFT_552876 [Sistotremastrum niveocremeum HHB9708]
MLAKFVDIPIELVEDVLKGLFVQDIINLGQTCRYFRLIVTGSRYAFRNSCNLDMVALAEDRSLDSFSPWEIYSSAIRSKIIAERIRNDYPPLRPRLHTVCQVTSGLHIYDIPRSAIFIAEHLFIFEKSGAWYLRDTSDSSGISVPLTDRYDKLSEPCVQILKDQSAMYFAYFSRVDPDIQVTPTTVRHPPNLYVFKVSIARETFGHRELLATIYPPEQIRRPEGDHPMLFMRDNIVACHTSSELVLCDWKKNTGIILSFSDESETVPYIMEDGVLFHPSREGVVVQLGTFRSDPEPRRSFLGFMELEIPVSMPPLNPVHETWESTWHEYSCPISYAFSLHDIPGYSTVPLPHRTVTCTGVRELGGEPVMDLSIFSHSEGHALCGTISLSTWKLIAPLHIPFAYSDRTLSKGHQRTVTETCITTAGPRLVHVRTHRAEAKEMQVLLGPDDGAFGSCWVSLDAEVLLEYLAEVRRNPEDFLTVHSIRLLSFDVRRGKLLVFIGKNLHIIQY